jgi:hypothetical protein
MQGDSIRGLGQYWDFGRAPAEAEADGCSQSHPIFTSIDREDAGMCFVVAIYPKGH